MNYLVTGAAGFIGSAIVRKLISMGNKCVTIDNLSTGKKENIPSGCDFIDGSTSDKKIIDFVKNKYKKFDAIIHIAGQSSGEISFEDPVYDLQTNTQSTVLLLKMAMEIGCNKFIYASSMSTYGDHEPPICSETTDTIPKSFYAVGKLASENYMRIFSNYGIACTALRFFNVYGVGQNLDNLKQGMASIFLAQAINNHHIIVKGSKDRFRDFVYVEDVVDAVLKSLERENGFEIYNVCNNKATTVESVINEIKKNLAYEVSVEYIGNTPGDQFGIYGDNSKIKEELNWRPKHTFESGMKEMVEWAIKELGK